MIKVKDISRLPLGTSIIYNDKKYIFVDILQMDNLPVLYDGKEIVTAEDVFKSEDEEVLTLGIDVKLLRKSFIAYILDEIKFLDEMNEKEIVWLLKKLKIIDEIYKLDKDCNDSEKS
jgi:hypothetical protein